VETLRKHKEILIILIFSTCVVLSAGLTSDLYLGDEVYHYRFAKDIYQAGKRVAFDPIYSTGNPPGYFYSSEPLWSGLLAILWRLVGNISFPVAQIYHTFYYLLLILLTYLLGIQIYGKKEGIYAALLILSAPMAVSFGILFYLDLPGSAFAALSLLLFLKRRYFLTGLAIALMYFTRRNACFLVPGFMLGLFLFSEGKLSVKLRYLSYLVLPAGCLGFMDIHWRFVHIESAKNEITSIGKGVAAVSNIEIPSVTSTLRFIKDRMGLWGGGEYLNSSLLSPKDLIKYFGIAILLGIFFYFWFKRDKRSDFPILICVAGYLLLFFLFFGIKSDIRYLFPIISLLCVLASSSFKAIEHLKWVKVLILIGCIIQLLGTSFYVHQTRLMPPGIKEGFSFIKKNTPARALFMYPGYIFIEATGRRFIWEFFFETEGKLMSKKYPYLDFRKDKSAFLFWNKEEGDLREILEMNKLDYIVVDKSKIYDDTKIKHFGGYPKSFIERIHTLPFLENVFENREMSIWAIKGNWRSISPRNG
jgi:4-amino-4-deoxy-L-arabinose transferase-like glycosyltransferase